jgi:hypothetical protein
VKLLMLTALPKRRTGDSEERIVIITSRGGSLSSQTLVTGSNLSTLVVKLPTNKFTDLRKWRCEPYLMARVAGLRSRTSQRHDHLPVLLDRARVYAALGALDPVIADVKATLSIRAPKRCQQCRVKFADLAFDETLALGKGIAIGGD